MDFYYSRKKLLGLFVFSVLVLFGAVYSTYFFKMSIGLAIVILSFPTMFVSATSYVLFWPQRLAHLDKRAIQIDQSVPLLWSDVVAARKTVSSCLCGRKIIVFDLKPRVFYPLTTMQDLCKKTRFTAFSIPLYAMTAKDQQKICKEIAKHCKLVDD